MANDYCKYIANGGILLLAAIVMFTMAQGAVFPATASRYMSYGAIAGVIGFVLVAIGIWKRPKESSAPKESVSTEDEDWS